MVEFGPWHDLKHQDVCEGSVKCEGPEQASFTLASAGVREGSSASFTISVYNSSQDISHPAPGRQTDSQWNRQRNIFGDFVAFVAVRPHCLRILALKDDSTEFEYVHN